MNFFNNDIFLSEKYYTVDSWSIKGLYLKIKLRNSLFSKVKPFLTIFNKTVIQYNLLSFIFHTHILVPTNNLYFHLQFPTDMSSNDNNFHKNKHRIVIFLIVEKVSYPLNIIHRT